MKDLENSRRFLMVKHFIKTMRLPVTILLISTALLGACASARSEPMVSYDQAAGAPVPVVVEKMVEAEAPMEMPAAEFGGDFAEESYRSDIQNQADAAERIVIKNASLALVVDDPSASMDNISRLAEEMGGFVVNANLYQQFLEAGVEVPRASITIRVPAERLNEALGRIKAESDQDPQSESINSQDVTSDYVDLQSRLSNLESAEAQLTLIMEDAYKTEDVLAVYNELVRVREQIEIIKGQIKYYEESAALSSINTELIANEAAQPLTIGGWQPQGVAKGAVQALINTMQFIVNAVIWIAIYVLPVLLVLYLIVFLPISFLWKRWRKRRAEQKKNVLESTSSNAE
jgi:hypothetical protein